MSKLQLTEHRLIERPDILFCMCRDSAGAIYCGSSDANVYRFDMEREESDVISLRGHRSYVTGITMTVGGRLISAGWDRQLLWWDLGEQRPTRRVQAHAKWIRAVTASPRDELVASIADDMICRVWDARTGNLEHELAGHKLSTPQHYPSMLHACAFSPDGSFLATGDKLGHVKIWDVASGRKVAEVESPEVFTWDPVQRRHSIGGIRSLRFSPDGQLLAVGGIGHINNIDGLGGKALVQVYDWRNGERVHKFEHDEHKGIVEDLHFIKDGECLVGAGGAKKGMLLVMDMGNGEFAMADTAPMHIHQFHVDDNFSQLTAVGHQAVGVWGVTDDVEPPASQTAG